ncbi:MAG: signal peptidase II [Sedimentisphaerales bacterium]
MTETMAEKSSTRASSEGGTLKRRSLALPDSKAHLIFWSLMLGGLVLDLLSKKAVFNWLQNRETATVINGFLRLIRALNNGAAFGVLAGKPYFLTVVSIVALVVVFGVFLFSGNGHRLVQVALGLFTAGICGNLYDRIFNDGLVRDFIDVYYHDYHWPAFNVADSLLCIGVGLLIISTFLTEKSAQKHAQQHK